MSFNDLTNKITEDYKKILKDILNKNKIIVFYMQNDDEIEVGGSEYTIEDVVLTNQTINFFNIVNNSEHIYPYSSIVKIIAYKGIHY